ncbi:hypothetical protein Cni_G01202 [Canna indica]|uniref:RING-CH-type domain-containing protein n=1 Tax=Canna indica TaxID=4628 RepID=A0AAQ3JM31_9LILI|nr:hypothetical protein Cni_G01202 [Canna indica]
MGDHFMLLVDRLLTESTLEAAIGSRNQASNIPSSKLEDDFSPRNKIVGDGMFTGKLVECRIFQDEDEDINMEIPCSCCGSLKYAHRKCVQKWCNEKGDTTCEICLQQFKPGYTAPPKLFLYGTSPMNFRGNWEVSSQEIHHHQYVTMTQTDRLFIRPNYDDYVASNNRNIMYFRIVATIFMIILVLRPSLPIIMTEPEQYSVPLFSLLVLTVAGIVLPLYIMLRVFTIFYQRRQLQETQEGRHLHPLQIIQPQSHVICIR